MNAPRWFALLAAVVFASSTHLACNGQDNAKPPATQNEQAAAKPVEFLEPAAIYQKLTAAPTATQAGAAAPAEGYTPVVTRLGHGQFDWSRRVVQSTGQAKADGRSAAQKLMAMRAAEVIAKRNALLVAADVPIDATGRVGNLRAGQVDVDGSVRGAINVKDSFDPASQTATVTMDVPMTGLRGVVRVAPAGGAGTWTWVVRNPVAEAADIVLIDARHLTVSPVLAPKLVTPDGKLIFQPDAQTVSDKHAFLYVRTASTRRLAAGEFTRPITLMPGKADGGSLVLTDADLTELCRHADAQALLRAGRAVIVLHE